MRKKKTLRIICTIVALAMFVIFCTPIGEYRMTNLCDESSFINVDDIFEDYPGGIGRNVRSLDITKTLPADFMENNYMLEVHTANNSGSTSNNSYTNKYTFYYLDMLDFVNLWNDGSYYKDADGTMHFHFGGHDVAFKDNENWIQIDGNYTFLGKVRYVKKSEMPGWYESNPIMGENYWAVSTSYQKEYGHYGVFIGQNYTYFEDVTAIGQWIPAQAIDELVAIGYRGRYVNVPLYYSKDWNTTENLVTSGYSYMRNLLPEAVAKENSVNPDYPYGFIYGPDYSQVDNYMQLAIMHDAFYGNIEGYEEVMTTEERASHYKEDGDIANLGCSWSKQGSIKFDFYMPNSLAKQRGFAWTVTVDGFTEQTESLFSNTVAAAYPVEIAHQMWLALTTTTSHPEITQQEGRVQAAGRWKFFIEGNTATMFVDNHPAMPNEICHNRIENKSFTDFSRWGDPRDYYLGLREDFGIGRNLTDAEKDAIGMPKIWNTLSPEVCKYWADKRTSGEYVPGPDFILEPCTNNPFEGVALPTKYTEIKSRPSDWAKPEVNSAAEAGIIPDSIVKDYQSDITRSGFAELIVKALETKLNKTLPLGKAFSDASEDFIKKAEKTGVIVGVGDNKFDPTAKITRQEMALMIVRAVDLIEAQTGLQYSWEYAGIYYQLNDNKWKSVCSNAYKSEEFIFQTTDIWARDAMKKAYANGYIQGTGYKNALSILEPLGLTTCEQAILIVYRSITDAKTVKDEDRYICQL